MNFDLLNLVSELIAGLELFDAINPLLQDQLTVKIKQLAEGIANLNTAIRNYRFASVEEEIGYFKEIKPQLVQQYIFLTELNNFYEKVPDVEMQRTKRYKKEVDRMLYFLNTQKEFYNYIKREHTYNDERYFRRLIHVEAVHTLYSLNADIESNCSHGFLLAKIKAYQKLIALYTRQLNLIKMPLPPQQPNQPIPLVWKANKVDAVELVYALYYYGAVDTDKCTVQELAKQFGELFQIQITEQLYREYIDIKRRKIEPARFLVKLLNHFRNRVEEEYT